MSILFKTHSYMAFEAQSRCTTCDSEKLRSLPETEAEVSNMRHPQATLDGASCGKLNFFPTMVTSLVTWSHLAKSLVRCQCLETALGNMEGLKLNLCCREIQKIDWTAWQVHSEWFTWNHMKENWQKSMNSENSDLTCVLISLFQFRSVAPLRVNCSMTEAKWILRKSISDFHRMC